MANPHIPTPTVAAGLRSVGYRTLRGSLGADVRQPDLKQAALVSTATGFGTGAGAGIRNNGNDADQSQGVVAIRVGLAPAASGTVSLSYPAGVASGQYWYAAEWASLTPAAPAGGVQSIAWSATRPLVTGETLLLAYQWTIST